jgi:hypothetical protein
MGFKSIGEAGHARTSESSHHRHHAHVGSRRHAGDSRSKQHSELRQRSENDDQLTLGREKNQQLAAESRSLAVARFKSDLRIRETDDGTLKVKFKSQLKFNYEFQSEDGTTIQLSAKLKTRLSYEQAADGSFELKSRVKLQISALKESVQSGVAPALDSGEQGGPQSSAIGTSLQDFQDLVDQVTGQFLQDAASGDDLIVEIVDAFNELAGSVGRELPEQAAEPNVTIEAAPLVAAIDDSTPPADVSAPPVSDLAEPQAAEPTIDHSSDGVAAPLDDGGEVAASEDDAVASAPTSTVTRRSVLVDLRIKFVQSISGLANVLDSPAGDGDTSSINASVWERTKIDLRLATYSQTQTQSLSDRLPGINVDADA